MIELFWRFAVISALAFGGGQAVLPLVEHTAVQDTGWVSSQDFSSALAFSYVTPGPVLILATFIGYRAAGFGGAVAATLGAFMIPWLLATAAAQILRRYVRHPVLAAFGRAAGAAVVGLLFFTALIIARESVTAWPYAAIVLIAFPFARLRRIHPFFVLAGGAVAGTAAGLLGLVG